MKTVTAEQAQENLARVLAFYEEDDFSFADYMAECVTEECHVLHQALCNLEKRELAEASLKDYWANSVSGLMNAYVAANGYGETICAG